MERPDSDPLFASMPDTFEMHLKCPNIGLETYRRINKLEISHSVMQKKRVYLDTMYWVRFRDVVLGRNEDPSYVELYSVLKEACSQEALICPVSYSAISEMLKQDDEHTRRVTACIMDELSGAVCIERPDYLLYNELDYFLNRAVFQEEPMYQPSDLAWTRAAFFVGQPTMSNEALTDQEVLALQKCFEDGMASLSIEKLISRLGSNPKVESDDRHEYIKDITQQTTEKLNAEKTKPENLCSDFQRYVESEVIGIVDSMQTVLGPVMERAMQQTGYTKTLTDVELALCAKMLKQLLINAYKHGKIKNEIPQLFIGASLHALLRYDQKRNYKNNDYEDFRHAGSALPYCHAFLTEKSLAHMLKHPPASVEQQFDCKVFSKPSEALIYIRKLAVA